MTANPSQGLRATRRAPVRLTAAGRIALPLSIASDGIPIGQTDLVLTHDEASALRAELDRLLEFPPAHDRDTP
ncbi:hypothetical protein FM076_09905 [Streptomyces albus subsp. chlorinus]|uniref:hypothetical protein n=1 Tax=Streptomyces albus TaxID=1888 RepID=UPI00156DFEC6|nr:hypothetical protein [Streptomyces albus]NSC21500.1 hypothetical protein [Streptomyces albus subsp. chlorinus]